MEKANKEVVIWEEASAVNPRMQRCSFFCLCDDLYLLARAASSPADLELRSYVPCGLWR